MFAHSYQIVCSCLAEGDWHCHLNNVSQVRWKWVNFTTGNSFTSEIVSGFASATSMWTWLLIKCSVLGWKLYIILILQHWPKRRGCNVIWSRCRRNDAHQMRRNARPNRTSIKFWHLERQMASKRGIDTVHISWILHSKVSVMWGFRQISHRCTIIVSHLQRIHWTAAWITEPHPPTQCCPVLMYSLYLGPTYFKRISSFGPHCSRKLMLHYGCKRVFG